jgi:chromosomal replication initiator protein
MLGRVLGLAETYSKTELEEALRLKKGKRKVEVDFIVDQVARNLEVNLDDMYSRTRRQKVVMARDFAMHFIKKFCPYLSYSAIGKMFRRDHSTVLHSRDKMESYLFYDEYAVKYNEIDDLLKETFCIY